MKLNHNIVCAKKLIPLTVFVVYDRAETAHRLKITLDRANAECDEIFEFDLRLWRLDILELPDCWAQSLMDLEDADLLTVVFSCHGDALFSPELKYMINKWSNGGSDQKGALFINSMGPDCSEVSVEVLRALASQNHTGFFNTDGEGVCN